MRETDWNAKTRVVDVSEYASGRAPSPPGAGAATRPGERDDGFASVVTVVAKIPELYRVRRGPGAAANPDVVWRVPLEPSFAGRARALGEYFVARMKQDYAKAPPTTRAALLALPLLAYLVLGQGAPDEEAPPRADSQAAAVAPPAVTPRNEPPAATASAMPEAPAQTLKAPRSAPAALGRTLEARAADTAARGVYAEARALYAELAARNPHRAEFAAAARILKERDTPREP